MKILAFEFLSSGGVADRYPLDASLAKFQKQGSQMLESVCMDFLGLGHTIILPLDAKVKLNVKPDSESSCQRIAVSQEKELEHILVDAADHADAILIICPESDGCLEKFLQTMSPWSEKLICPDTDFVRLTGNKWQCYRWFDKHQIPTPKTILRSNRRGLARFIEDIAFPWVVKPIDGAGSEQVKLIFDREQLLTIQTATIIQEFVSGTSASVSVIAQRNGELDFCEPGEQVFETQPFGPHIRTQIPLPDELRERALLLANRVTDALPPTRGYFGIDMVLGENADRDVVIEVNPRMTTSYCDLRKWSQKNLAEVMLQ